MKNYTPDKLRTVSVIGHGSVGKTSLCEALLFTGKGSDRLGSVDSGSSNFDHTAESRERKHSLSASIGLIEWNGVKVNIIDTPGLADFYGETIGAIAVSDGVVLVLDGFDGVEVGSLKTWDQASLMGKPVMIWINRVDKDNADFSRVLENAREILGRKVVPVVFPVHQNGTFKALVNVMTGKAVGPDGLETAVPASAADDLESYRMQLTEVAAEADDQLMDSYFENETLTPDELHQGIRKGVRDRSFFPLFAGTAVPPAGASFLLDAVTEFMPSPLESPAIPARDGAVETSVSPKSDGPFVARAFSTKVDPHMGEIVFIRVVSGGIEGTHDILNSTRNTSERLGNYYFINGPKRTDADRLVTGDIAAVAKLKTTTTNDTLVGKGTYVVLQPIRFPEPVFRVAIAPVKRGEEDKMGSCLSRFASQDPTFILRNEAAIGQTTVSAMGDLHLKVILSRLKEMTGVETETFKPRIAYHETISRKAEGSYKHKKQTGGRGQYGHVFLRLEPMPRGGGFSFESQVVGGNVPTKFIQAVEKGVIEALKDGPISRSEVVDIKVVIFDGSSHPVDSSDMAFKLAARKCFREVMMNAGPSLLEPVVSLEVTVPEEFMGDVMGDLNTRRGKIQGMESEGAFQVIKALIPEAELFQYTSTLKSLTQARGSFSQRFEGYEPVPREVQEKVQSEVQHSDEE